MLAGSLQPAMLVLMRNEYPEFRLGSVLATSFTGTRSERYGTAIERIPTPERLGDWLEVSGLAVPVCNREHLTKAYELREAIHLATTSAAVGNRPPDEAIEVMNEYSAQGHAALALTSTGEAAWRLRTRSSIADALGVIAADAITVLAGQREGRLALCDSPTCRAAFFDISRSRTRRWCDMGICGNRNKKARFNATKQSGGG